MQISNKLPEVLTNTIKMHIEQTDKSESTQKVTKKPNKPNLPHAQS